MDRQPCEIGSNAKDVVLLRVSGDQVDVLYLSAVSIDESDGLRDEGYCTVLETGCQRRGYCLTIGPKF